jgi:hypothetical protein
MTEDLAACHMLCCNIESLPDRLHWKRRRTPDDDCAKPKNKKDEEGEIEEVEEHEVQSQGEKYEEVGQLLLPILFCFPRSSSM